ncbi:MAG: PilZ domain-containing protein [Phycisphaerales bacterium]|nr:PilZ domain-containing protein [Phycisphaerales bacterium]
MFRKSPKKPGGNWAPGSAGARAYKRTKCADLYCNLGRVVDLSPTGAGLLTEAAHLSPGARETIHLDTEHGPLEIIATVTWTRPEAERLRRVGFRFADRDHRVALTSLCRRLRDEELDRRDSTRF